MPPDRELSEEQIRRYDEARCFFLKNPDAECIPYLLNSFGEGSGFGVYQLVEQVIKQFSIEQVVPHLVDALHSSNRSVREWSAEIASNFRAPELVRPLAALLEDDAGVRYMAVTALEAQDTEQARLMLKEHLHRESDPEIRDLIIEAIASD